MLKNIIKEFSSAVVDMPNVHGMNFVWCEAHEGEGFEKPHAHCGLLCGVDLPFMVEGVTKQLRHEVSVNIKEDSKLADLMVQVEANLTQAKEEADKISKEDFDLLTKPVEAPEIEDIGAYLAQLQEQIEAGTKAREEQPE